MCFDDLFVLFMLNTHIECMWYELIVFMLNECRWAVTD